MSSRVSNQTPLGELGNSQLAAGQQQTAQTDHRAAQQPASAALPVTRLKAQRMNIKVNPVIDLDARKPPQQSACATTSVQMPADTFIDSPHDSPHDDLDSPPADSSRFTELCEALQPFVEGDIYEVLVHALSLQMARVQPKPTQVADLGLTTLQLLCIDQSARRVQKLVGFSKDPEGKVMLRYRRVLPPLLDQRLVSYCDEHWLGPHELRLPSDLKVLILTTG
jgi:hypothetical protein